MPTSGHPFEPVVVEEPAAAPAPGEDTRFAAPQEPPFRITSEELASKAPPAGAAAEPAGDPASLAPSDAAIAGTGEPLAAPPAEAPALAATSPISLFPVRLLSTLPTAQPPRAVVGLPDGREVVVSPGSVLGPEGLVVMAVLEGRVQLARVRPAGDHATIESVEITAQYP